LRPPPSVRPKLPGWTGSVGWLVFANRLDGYALEQSANYVHGTTAYATTDGGHAWRRVSFGADTSVGMVASAGEFYTVLTHCRGKNTKTTTATCDSNHLGRSAAGSTSWSIVTIPGVTSEDNVALSTDGAEVLLNYQSYTGANPVLLVSNGGRAPFSTAIVPSLDSGNGCGLTAMHDGVWANCLGGMNATLLHSRTPRGPYKAVWTYAGTGGGGFDPLTGKTVYRYTGIASFDPKIAGNELQLSTNGGESFRSVGPMPFATASLWQLIFMNTADGFALGSVIPPRGSVNNEVPTLFETHDGGRSWQKVTF
ncbi:MAG: hypothetical protein ACYDBS_09175, partial [Acidimicrobiales bacterium]